MTFYMMFIYLFSFNPDSSEVFFYFLHFLTDFKLCILHLFLPLTYGEIRNVSLNVIVHYIDCQPSRQRRDPGDVETLKCPVSSERSLDMGRISLFHWHLFGQFGWSGWSLEPTFPVKAI